MLCDALRAAETHAVDVERVTMPDTWAFVFDDKGSIPGFTNNKTIVIYDAGEQTPVQIQGGLPYYTVHLIIMP